MVTSTHAVAIFEEGFMVVDVSPDDVDAYGADEMHRSIAEHDFVAAQNTGVVITYPDVDGDDVYYGAEELAKPLSQVNAADIDWGNELTLEWPTVTTTHPVAPFDEGFILVGVDPADVKAYGDEEMWRAIQEHEFIQSKGIPVVTVYQDSKGRANYFGDSAIVDSLAKQDFDKIKWTDELTLEWLATTE
jgi:hypothetical protein